MAILHGAAGTTVSLIVVSALSLVEGLLGSALVLVGLATTSHAVGGVSDGLLDLVLGGLGGVRSHLLLGLCEKGFVSNRNEERRASQLQSRTSGEVLAAGVRHNDGLMEACLVGCEVSEVLNVW